MADVQADSFDACQLCAVQVVTAARDGVDRLVGGSVALDETLEGSGPKLGGFCRRALGRFEWAERGIARVRRSHWKIQKTLTGKKAHGYGLWRWPSDGPVAGGHGQPELVSGRKCISDVVQVHLYQIPLARFKGSWMLMAVAVGQVQQSVSYPGRCAAGGNVVQADSNTGHGLVNRNLQGYHRRAQDFDYFPQRIGVENQRTTVVTTLVQRRLSWCAKSTPFAGTNPGGLGGTKIELSFDRRCAAQPTHIEPVTFDRDTRRRPLSFCHPAARALFIEWLRRDAFLHPDPQHRLGHNARIGALQPVVPPAERLLQESDGRTRYAVVRIKMGPGSDEALARSAESGQEPGNRVAVGIGPTADSIHSTGYGAVVFAD